MPITIMQGGVIPNYFEPNSRVRTAAQNVIAMLEYADIWRGPGTLRDNEVVRVDMQGHIAGPPIQYNIQVQVDGIQGNSTVAHANVSATIMTNDPMNQRGALNKVISALNLSLDTGCSYSVAGAIP